MLTRWITIGLSSLFLVTGCAHTLHTTDARHERSSRLGEAAQSRTDLNAGTKVHPSVHRNARGGGPAVETVRTNPIGILPD